MYFEVNGYYISVHQFVLSCLIFILLYETDILFQLIKMLSMCVVVTIWCVYPVFLCTGVTLLLFLFCGANCHQNASFVDSFMDFVPHSKIDGVKEGGERKRKHAI